MGSRARARAGNHPVAHSNQVAGAGTQPCIADPGTQEAEAVDRVAVLDTPFKACIICFLIAMFANTFPLFKGW